MAGNATTRFDNVALLSVASTLPGRVTTSDEIETRLAVALRRLKLPSGLLKRVAGVQERRNWAAGESSDAATIAAGTARAGRSGRRPSDVGLLINTSVTRKHLEPSVAVRTPPRARPAQFGHQLRRRQRLPRFRQRHEPRGEHDRVWSDPVRDRRRTAKTPMRSKSTRSSDCCSTDVDRDDFMSEFATLTLGSGSAAAVLGRADEHPAGHRILGGVTRAATQFHDLCVGSVDGMFTDAKALLKGGLDLVVSAWKEARSRVELEVDGPVHHASGLVGAHQRDHQGCGARPLPCSHDVSAGSASRAGVDADHPRRGAGDARTGRPSAARWAWAPD